jgi:hypothetical protein
MSSRGALPSSAAALTLIANFSPFFTPALVADRSPFSPTPEPLTLKSYRWLSPSQQ